MNIKQIEDKLDILMQYLLHHATNGISLVKESALSAISSAV
jgi:hypothetical protein